MSTTTATTLRDVLRQLKGQQPIATPKLRHFHTAIGSFAKVVYREPTTDDLTEENLTRFYEWQLGQAMDSKTAGFRCALLRTLGKFAAQEVAA